MYKVLVNFFIRVTLLLKGLLTEEVVMEMPVKETVAEPSVTRERYVTKRVIVDTVIPPQVAYVEPKSDLQRSTEYRLWKEHNKQIDNYFRTKQSPKKHLRLVKAG